METDTCFILYLVDADLTHKLNEELEYEKSNEEAGQPEFIKEFLEANSFKVKRKVFSLDRINSN